MTPTKTILALIRLFFTKNNSITKHYALEYLNDLIEMIEKDLPFPDPQDIYDELRKTLGG